MFAFPESLKIVPVASTLIASALPLLITVVKALEPEFMVREFALESTRMAADSPTDSTLKFKFAPAVLITTSDAESDALSTILTPARPPADISMLSVVNVSLVSVSPEC